MASIARAGTGKLTDRALKGMLAERLEIAETASWVDAISTKVGSDSDSEEFANLNRPPTMKAKQSGSDPSRPTAVTWVIENEEYEASAAVPKRIIRRDKTGMINRYFDDMARRPVTHWRKLLTDLLLALDSTVISRDNKNFFSATHFEGDQTSQANLVTASQVSELDVVDSTDVTSVELVDAILGMVGHFYSYKDADAEPFNEDAMEFLCMMPQALAAKSTAAFTSSLLNNGSGTVENAMVQGQYRITPAVNPRFTSATEIYLFRTDTANKPVMRQSEALPGADSDDVELIVLGLDSEYCKLNGEILAKLECSRNVGATHNWHTAMKGTISTA